MAWLSLVLGFLATVVFVASRFIPKSHSDSEVRKTRKVMGVVSGLVLVVSGLFMLWACVRVVSPGHAGVQMLFGSVSKRALSPGLHIVIPFTHVEEYSTRTETYVMSATHSEGDVQGDDSITVISSNDLKLPMDVTVPYRLLPEATPWIHSNFGPSYETLLRQCARTALRRAAGKFTGQECWATKRDELAEQAKDFLDQEFTLVLSKYGETAPKEVLQVSQILIGNVTIPDTVRESIEKKLAADQKQQEMDFRIKEEQKEAERKIIEAKGIQEFQTIVSQGITPDLLRWKGIEATLELSQSNNAKIVVIGNPEDGLPLILGGLEEKPRPQE